jgi:hypothetical protein
MGRYDSHKNPISYMLNSWAHRRVNESREREPKSMPAHIQKIEKDFVHVAFDTRNSIFTPPVMKMTQSFSRFGREPTQQKDMGLCVPGDYYMGGNTAFSGGRANYYPRGNLSSLSFQPLGNLKAPKRDYDQHWETGGPNGWRCKVMEDQQKSGGQQTAGTGGSTSGGNGSASAAVARTQRTIMQQRNPILFASNGSITPYATNGSGSSSQGGQSGQPQQQKKKDYTEFSFDKKGRIIAQSVDRKHYLDVNQEKKQVTLTGEGTTDIFGKQVTNIKSGQQVNVDPGGQSSESGAGWDEDGGQGGSQGGGGGGGGSGGGMGKVYLGGDGKKGKYCPVETKCGTSINVYARVG